MTLFRIHDDRVAVVLDTSAGVPSVVHWGPDPGPLPASGAALLDRPLPPATLDVEPPLTLVPTAAAGFPGRPGIECHRASGPVFPRFDDATVTTSATAIEFESDDAETGVRIEGSLRLGEVIEVELAVVNLGPDVLFVDHLAPTLSLPDDAEEVLRFSGQWGQEFHPRRGPWPAGTQLVESRRGRTSHDAVPVAFFGPTGFDEQHGDLRGVHLSWSGNHQLRIDRLADGRRYVQAAELLAPGEVALQPGERHGAPTVLAVAGTGLSQCSQRFHRHVRRSLPTRPRPVLLNTWEAVYFDHDQDRLFALADRAAHVGVERFVLDDGWFGGRRDDTAGLGDWWVSPDVYPQGLAPLIEHVTGLGMEFGIWVEPEMVNPDSELYRAHPDWVLGNADATGRNQLVLDLARADCWNHFRDVLDRLLADHDIAFVKWDMNRDLAGAGSHHQTRALYRLLDALRAAHPAVEIESCASGGGRADAEILRRTARIWTSDCNDALERQAIQRGFSHLLPPEVMGAHIGPPRAHTTGRVQRLAFRAATALFGHLGIEWNLLDADDRDLDKLREWIDLHKRLRPLLHGGDVVRLDQADRDTLAHGVVSTDRSEAVFCHAQLRRPDTSAPPRLVLAGLDPDRGYTLERIVVPGNVGGLTWHQPRWLDEPVTVSGRVLMTMGIQLPILLPESALLFRLTGD